MVPEALVKDAPCRYVLPETVKAVAEAVVTILCPVTNKGPETVRAVEEALAKEEVAVAVIEVKEGFALKVI